MGECQHRGAATRRLLLRRLAASLGLLALGAPAVAARRPPVLNGVLQWLPGRFESASAELIVVPVYAPRAGAHAFYLRISPFDAAEDALSQSLLAASPGRRSRCTLQQWRLLEPRRWRNAHLSPDLFKSLVPDDLAPGPAISLDWDPTVTRVMSAPDSAFRFELDPTAVTLTERYERR
jgi:hypothetical protein